MHFMEAQCEHNIVMCQPSNVCHIVLPENVDISVNKILNPCFIKNVRKQKSRIIYENKYYYFS
jgi:hypothetical protein